MITTQFDFDSVMLLFTSTLQFNRVLGIDELAVSETAAHMQLSCCIFDDAGEYEVISSSKRSTNVMAVWSLIDSSLKDAVHHPTTGGVLDRISSALTYLQAYCEDKAVTSASSTP